MDSALSSPSHECQSYHFASQNVLLTNSNPSHFGTAGPERIFIVYEQSSLLQIYRFNNGTDHRLKPLKLDRDDGEVFAVEDEPEKKEQFVLERTVQLYDSDIVQAIHCPLVPEYFGFLTNSRITKLRSVRIYSNYLSEVDEKIFKIRLNGELISSISASPDYKLPTHMEKLDAQLNIIEFQHSEIGSLANYIHSCPATGNFVVSIANGTILVYRYTRCILPANKHFVAIDFVFIKTITILDGWTPEVVKLSLNYIALMGQTHFSLIQIALTDQAEYDNGHHQLEYGYDAKFKVADETHLIYNRLFDDVAPHDAIFGFSKTRVQTKHADTVWGPVDESLSCKFAVHDHNESKTTESPCNVLFCRNLTVAKQKRTKPAASSPEPRFHLNELSTLRGKGKLCADQSASTSTDSKLYLFGMELLPYRDRNGLIFAHALYMLWANQLHCYLIDLRRDKLRLVPVSKLDFTDLHLKSTPLDGHSSSLIIRDFSANPQEDLVHILTDSSFDTYATQMFNFLVSESSENIYCSRPIADLYPVSTHIFFNLIVALSSAEFVFLISSEESSRHTIYNLRRPSLDHLQADLLSTIDDIKSNSDDDQSPNSNHSLHRMYLQLHAITKFTVLFPTRSHSVGGGSANSGTRQERLEAFHRKIHNEMEAILAENPTCDYAMCPFVGRAFGN